MLGKNKKIIILSYFYPPAGFVGGERISGWVKYLHEFGFYPIVVTRQWNKNQSDLTDDIHDNSLQIEYNETHEVHRLPYVRSLRDRCAKYKWLKYLRKTLTFIEMLFSNFFITVLPFSNFYIYTKKIINEQDISILIASGRPFQSFYIGHKLKKEFPKIHWIPDYRDEWNSFKRGNVSSGNLPKLIQYFERRSEKKWTANASAFVSVGTRWVDEIASFIKKRGVLIYNGYDPHDYELKNVKNQISHDRLIITYAGTLYENQPIEEVINLIKRFIMQWPDKKITLNFVGIEMNPIPYRNVINLTKAYSGLFKIYPRVSKQELAEIYEKSDLLLMTKYEGAEGITPVKLFDYFNSSTPILFYPTDNSAIHDFIVNTNCGYVIKNDAIALDELHGLFEIKQENKTLKKIQNNEYAINYTVENQTKKLAKFLDDIT